MCVIFWRSSGVATKKSVWKLDCIKTGKGHEVYYVGNKGPLMIFQEGVNYQIDSDNELIH